MSLTCAVYFHGSIIQRRCKERSNLFEIAYEISELGKEKSKLVREKIAKFLRNSMIKNGLPKDIEPRKYSTLVATKINLSSTDDSKDFINDIDGKQIQKIISFYHFLDEKLDEWNNKNLINLIE